MFVLFASFFGLVVIASSLSLLHSSSSGGDGADLYDRASLAYLMDNVTTLALAWYFTSSDDGKGKGRAQRQGQGQGVTGNR